MKDPGQTENGNQRYVHFMKWLVLSSLVLFSWVLSSCCTPGRNATQTDAGVSFTEDEDFMWRYYQTWYEGLLIAARAASHRDMPRGPNIHTFADLSACYVYDDLGWLVGKWWCIEMHYADAKYTWPRSSTATELIEWFNVYYPFADTNLTLKLSGNPADRPIAAEFVIRYPATSVHYRGLGRAEPAGMVAISTNFLWVGRGMDVLMFEYHLNREGKVPRLVMQLGTLELVFERVSEDPGDIRDSFAIAPIRYYSGASVSQLQRRYVRLTKSLRRKCPETFRY